MEINLVKPPSLESQRPRIAAHVDRLVHLRNVAIKEYQYLQDQGLQASSWGQHLKSEITTLDLEIFEIVSEFSHENPQPTTPIP